MVQDRFGSVSLIHKASQSRTNPSNYFGMSFSVKIHALRSQAPSLAHRNFEGQIRIAEGRSAHVLSCQTWLVGTDTSLTHISCQT